MKCKMKRNQKKLIPNPETFMKNQLLTVFVVLSFGLSVLSGCSPSSDSSGSSNNDNSSNSQRLLKSVSDISVGPLFSCALLSNGTIKCWGASSALGTDPNNTSIIVPEISNASSVSVGGEHACAVIFDSTIKCWGRNQRGQLGDGTRNENETNSPVTVFGISDAIEISAGRYHTCAVLSDGTIKCWGYNSLGQVGAGTNATSDIESNPVTVTGISNAISVSAGNDHTCAVLSDGSVRCWGTAFSLGDGISTNSFPSGHFKTVEVTGISNAISVSAGGSHTCALLSDGSIKCWGYNYDGQLGDASNTTRITPVNVAGISNAISVSAGDDHTCSVLESGLVKCWGSNTYLQLGNGLNLGYNPGQNQPNDVFGISTAVAVESSLGSSCALLSVGTVKCWGFSTGGLFGDQIENSTPVYVLE